MRWFKNSNLKHYLNIGLTIRLLCFYVLVVGDSNMFSLFIRHLDLSAFIKSGD